VTDTTAPSTSVVNPLAGTTVSGTQPISVTASDNVGVADGAIMIDGAIVASFSGTSATYNWNTSRANAGGHTLQSKVQDAAGNLGTSAPVSVTVALTDVTRPTVYITYPTSGATIASGSQTVTANASDDVGVTLVKTFLNGSLVCQDTAAPYACPISVSGSAATIVVTAFDAAGNSGTHEVNVKVAAGGSSPTPNPTPTPIPTPRPADVTVPGVTITYPGSGSRLPRGSLINITANASDNVGVASVRTYANGTLVCTDTAPPYSCPWTVWSTGKVRIQVKAFDAAGNVGADDVSVFPR
jgi:hypothetical protein